jgi:TusA-related sulfurtransferase
MSEQSIEYESKALEATDAPADAPTETLDVRRLGPPKPLTETLQSLSKMADDAVLVQLNDRAPQHLYPKLDERGYTYETVEVEDVVVTAIWSER